MNKILSLIIFLSLFTGNAFSQADPITGTVLDKDGFPIISAVVEEVGAQNYTTTDFDGNFSLRAKNELPTTLKISAVGFKTQSIQLYEISEDAVTIVLKSDNLLDEVVIIGYGSQKKGDLTGAVGSVSKELIEQQPVSSLDRAIQGAVAGVQVTQTSGQPGGGVSIRVRGGGSIQGGNEPLYVVDGFPIYNSSSSAGVTSGGNVNALSSINPSDIESIDILKDASATAIYGSRGANGVIIITTKRGKKNKAQISFESSYGLQTLQKKIDLLDAKEFASLRNDALFDSNPSLGPNQYLSQSEIDQLGKGVDWQDAAFRVAPIQQYQLSLLGGNEDVRYAISGGYFKQDGILTDTDFKRWSTRINLDVKATEKIKVGLSLTGNSTNSNIAANPSQGLGSSIVTALLSMPPTASIYEADGSFTLRNPFENIISNPIATLKQRINESNGIRLLGTTFAEYSILDNLVFKTSFGLDYNSTKENSYIPTTLYEGSVVNGQASIGVRNSHSLLNENTLTYTNNFNKHNLDLLAGYTTQVFKSDIVRSGASQFVSNAFTYNSLQSGSTPGTPFSNRAEWSLVSYLARVNYSYNNRYFLTSSIRADGSSRFGKNNKWGYFPSVGVAWKINNEAFFSPLSSKISDLKLRASFGSTGNQEIGVYQSLSTLTNVNYLFNDNLVTGFTPQGIANDNLGWETTNQFDVGLDLGFFENKLLVSLDGYYKKTTDLLLNVELPWTSGYSTSLQNFGAVENKGIEVSVNTINFDGDFSWNTNFNISFNRNKLLSLGDLAEDSFISGDYIVKVGEPLGTFYGTVTDGILQAEEESTKGIYTGNASPKAGDRLYKDINGDGQFTTAADRTIIGNAQPDYIFGITNNFSWKGFDLSIFFQGSVGNEILNQNLRVLELFNGQQNAAGVARNRWTASNPSSVIPRAKLDPAPVFSDRLIEDGTYVRLKNLTFGYTLPQDISKKLKFDSVRLFVTGYNLITWTNYSGFDPEVTSVDNTVSQGTDAGVYPSSRTITTGFKINF